MTQKLITDMMLSDANYQVKVQQKALDDALAAYNKGLWWLQELKQLRAKGLISEPAYNSVKATSAARRTALEADIKVARLARHKAYIAYDEMHTAAQIQNAAENKMKKIKEVLEKLHGYEVDLLREAIDKKLI